MWLAPPPGVGVLGIARLDGHAAFPAIRSRGHSATFSGVGGTNTSGGALTALNAFETAIGGGKNTAAAPQTGGFRTITWDGVKLDGTDFGGGANTTVINLNKTVGIPLNRFQAQGTFFEEVYAVSGDGFTDVNPNVTGLFPAFSPSNTFAMFNDNTIDQSFVLPSATAPPRPSPARAASARSSSTTRSPTPPASSTSTAT